MTASLIGKAVHGVSVRLWHVTFHSDSGDVAWDVGAKDRPHLASGKAFKAWLGKLQLEWFAHGSELVHLLAEGSCYGAAEADGLLSWACSAGIIVRGKFAPTKSQQFFDVNRSYRHSPEVQYHAYGYMPGFVSIGKAPRGLV